MLGGFFAVISQEIHKKKKIVAHCVKEKEMVAEVCTSIALMLTAWTLSSDVIFPLHLHVTPQLEIANISLTQLAFGTSHVSYNSSMTLLELKSPTSLAGSVSVIVNQTEIFQLSLGLELTAGQVVIATTTLNESSSSCLTQSAVLAGGNCSVTPLITSISISPNIGNVDWLLNVTAFIVDIFHDAVCNAVAQDLINLLSNHTPVAPALPPPLDHGATPLSDAALFAGVVNIVNNLPVLLGLGLKAKFISGNTLELDIDLAHGINYSSSSSMAAPFGAFVSKMTGLKGIMQKSSIMASLMASLYSLSDSLINLDQLVIPAGTTVQLQLAIRHLECSNRLTCTIPRRNPVRVVNVRLAGDGEFDRFVDLVIGKLVEDIVNLLLLSPSTFSASSSADVGGDTLVIAIPDKYDSQIPPLKFILPFGLLVMALAAGIVLYSARGATCSRARLACSPRSQ